MNHHHMQHIRILTLLFTGLLIWGIPSGWAQPLVDLGADTTLCGGTLTLDAGSPGSTYSWSTGASSQTIQVSISDVYWVDVTDGGGTTRDSINVYILQTPQSPQNADTVLCNSEEIFVNTSGNGDAILWFADSSGSEILGIGDTLGLSIQDTTTVYNQAINTTTVVSGGMPTPSNSLFLNNTRGLRIETENSLVLQTTTVYCNQPTTFELRILETGNQIVFQKVISLPTAGAHLIPIFLPLEGESVYRVYAWNINGQLASSNVGLNFPYVFPDLMQIVGDQSGSTSIYRYFYDIKVSAGICGSALNPLTINLLPSPVLDLGLDTVLCGGSLTLDATNPNGQYLWDNGTTNPTLVVNATDTASVLVSIGSCTAEDSIVVQVLDQPLEPVLPDTTICKDPTLLLQANSASDRVLWFSDSLGENILSMDNPYLYTVSDSTTLYMQGVNTPQVFQAGIETPGNFIYDFSNRGMSFEVFRNLVLESVTVFTNQPTTFDLNISTKSGTPITTIPFSLPSAGKHVLPLFVSLGADSYKILGQNVTGGMAVTNTGLNYPYITGDYLSITGDQNNNATLFRYFFDFKFFQDYCFSGIQPVKINVLPTPEIDLGPDTVLCGFAPFTLDASYPNASYIWNTNETTSSIQTDTTGLYTVTASINTCSDTEDRFLLFIPAPDAPITQDTSICAPGIMKIGAQSTADRLFWFKSASGGELLSVDSLSVEVRDTTTFYVSAGNSSNIQPLGYSVNFNNLMTNSLRGLSFDVQAPSIVIHELDVFVGAPTTFTLKIVDQNQNVIDSANFENLEPVQDGAGNFLPQTLSLYMEIPEGENYEMIADIKEGEMGFSSTNVVYPFEIPGLAKISSDANLGLNLYYYFYNWRISRGLCYSQRVPLTVTVDLPLNLPEYVYSCSDTLLDAGNLSGTFLWNTGSTTQVISADTTGEYFVEVQNGLGCTARDTAFVEIPIDAGLQDDGILCGMTLITNYDEEAVFLWNTGDTTATLALADTGTYWVVVDEPRGCKLYDTIFVSGFDSFPTADLGTDILACDSALLDPSSPGNSYLWSTGNTTPTITVYSSGTFTVTVTNANNCVTSDTIGVSITPTPIAKFSVPDTIVNASLQVTFVNQSTFGAYNWDFGDGNASTLPSPNHTYTDTGTYCAKLIVNDILDNCGSDTVEHCFTLLEYNVGLEGLNQIPLTAYPNPSRDLFHLLLPQELVEYQIRIFDSAGKRVYEKHNQNNQEREVLIHCQNWANGLYQIQVLNHKGQSGYLKMLKQ